MKKTSLFLCLLSAFVLHAGEINVKNFGALGNGRNDDTAAIRKAADHAVKASRDPYAPKTLYFPSGTYIINGTIKLRAVSLKGNNAQLIQKDNKAVTFDYADFWHVRVSGLTFKNGKGHIAATNDNLDKSLFFVEHCKFFFSNGTSLQTHYGAQSTLFTVTNCEFIRCMCAIDSDCDWTVIRDTWIMNPEKMANSAVIVNRHGYMTVDNLLGVPLCNGRNQRWIDNYAYLTATNCRFGGEGGGYTPVYNFAKYNNPPALPMTVVVRECEVDAHSSGLRNCAVYCIEIPNLISLENCRSSFTNGIIVDKKIDLKKYFCGTKGDFAYTANSNVGFKENIIPGGLAKPVINPLSFPPGHLSEKAAAKKAEGYKPTVKTKGHCEVNALTQPGAKLVLANRMDGSAFFNKDLLWIVRKAEPACIMRRTHGKTSDAPFAELQHVKIDLDKTPYILLDMRSKDYGEFAIKIIDEEDGKMYAWAARQRPLGSLEVNIPKVIPELSGKKTFTFRIYYIGRNYVSKKGNRAHHFQYADAGSVLEIHEFGFNSKPMLKKLRQGKK